MTDQGNNSTEGSGDVLLTVRPRRIVTYATVATVAVVGTMIVIGVLLQRSSDGVRFRFADQVGLIGIGVLLGALILIAAARPLLRVDADGLRIRNMVGGRVIPWAFVHGISFPPGAQWPLVLMPDDETYPIIAIQAMDRQRSVAALKQLRLLFDTYATSRPEPTPAAKAARDADLRRQETQRPLGRLEVIDLQRAKNGKRRPRR